MKCTDCQHETMHSQVKLCGTGFMALERPGGCEEKGCQCFRFCGISEEQAFNNKVYHDGK